MPCLKRIIETALYVDDLEPARAFYEAVLELTPILKTKTLFAYDIGGESVLPLFQRGASLLTQTSLNGSIPPDDGAGPLHICFAIDRAELLPWEERLWRHDVTIESKMEWERGGKSLYFRDPDGHLLELLTRGVGQIY